MQSLSCSAVVDGCAFHEWPSSASLLDYMDEGWHELISPRQGATAMSLRGMRMLSDPFRAPGGLMELRNGSAPVVPGSDYDAFERDILAQNAIERVVLGYDIGLQSTAIVHRYLARDVARAANDWTVENWLARDDRLYGMVLVSTAIPEDAAAEIRRVGVNERMVAVALGCNGLGRPFGEPAYHPIFEAAEELGLPIVIQVGSDIASDMPNPPVAGGLPSTYAEFRAHAPHTHWAHTTSLIAEGVFTRFPKLKALLVGGGAAWIPAWLWNVDYWYKMTAAAYPWVERLPSEYFLEHIRVSTHSLEQPPQPERLGKALGLIDGIDRVILYTSGYPDEDWETAGQIATRLPAEWHERVFRTNAEELFRWPMRVTPPQEELVARDAAGGR